MQLLGNGADAQAPFAVQGFGGHCGGFGFRRQALGPSSDTSACPGSRQSSLCALADQFPLELGQRCEQIEDEPSLRAGRVDWIIQAEETDFTLYQVAYQFDQVCQRPSHAIELPTTPVPPSRIAALARFANTVKVSAVARLPVARRTATLVAFIHSLEASAQDDALDVLAILLRDLFAKAEQADRKVRLRSLKDLDQAASTLAEACRLLLDPNLPDDELRERVYAVIGHEELAKALTDVCSLVRPGDDVFYRELAEKRATVKRFLPTLLRVIRFDANAAARPLLEALQ